MKSPQQFFCFFLLVRVSFCFFVLVCCSCFGVVVFCSLVCFGSGGGVGGGVVFQFIYLCVCVLC